MLNTSKALSASGAAAETVQSIQQFIMDTDPTNPKNLLAQKDATASKLKVIDINSVINGKYSSKDTNVAINGVVARVVVDRINYDDFLANKSKYLDSTVRGTKRKLEESDLEELLSEDTVKSGVGSKKKRGRPAKKFTQVDPDYSDEETSSESDYSKKRGRPIIKEKPKSKPIIRKSNTTRVSLEKPQFNGGSPALMTTPRIRKPNSRLQDFVVSSSLGYYSPPPPTNKPVKESPTTPKEKPLKKVNKDPLDDDPLLITPIEIKFKTSNLVLKATRTTDEVRSFLPVFDEALPSAENDLLEEKPNKRKKPIKEKENQVINLQPKLIKSPKTYSPPKLRSATVEPTIDISKLQKSIAKTLESHTEPVTNNNTPVPAEKTKEVKVKPTKAETPVPAEKIKVKLKPTKAESAVVPAEKIKVKVKSPKAESTVVPAEKIKVKVKSPKAESTVVPPEKIKVKVKPTKAENEVPAEKIKEVKDKPAKAETKINGSNAATSKYVLVDSDVSRNRGKAQKMGDVDFNKLVRSLKLVKLPAANWKIRIVVSKQQTITEVTFTNKEVYERCIKFSRTITGYVITFGKNVVNLLGAPSKISSFNDVSILLDIVHHISLNDPVLEYSTSSNV